MPEPAEGQAAEQRNSSANAGAAAATGGETIDAAITFYTCPPYCATTASGESLYMGGAACGYGLRLGSIFQIENDPTGRTYTCNDRGLGPHWWVDIFFWDKAEGWAWLAQVGTQGRIVLLP